MHADTDHPAPLHRRSRWRTAEGAALTWREWISFPVACWQWVLLKTLGHRVERPWIPPSATRALAAHLPPDSHVLEIGSGFSTLWLSRRCARLLSIEADQGWFEHLRGTLAARGLTHVDLQFRWVGTEMSDFSQIPDHSLDLCVVDGGPRCACAQAAVPKLKPGGWLYLDNSDTNPDAKAFLRQLAAAGKCTLTAYRGFPPACLYVSEGLVAVFPS